MTSTQQTKERLQKELRELSDEIRTAADELRVKAHLAGMEVKQAWNKLEPRVHEFEERFDRAAGTAADEVKKLGKDLKTQLGELKKRL